MTEAEEHERAAFEKWWGENPETLTPGSKARYVWEGWSARALSPTAPQPDTMREAIADALGDITIARATLQDSVETHGTFGGWLDKERERLSRAEDTLSAALGETSVGEQTSGAKGND